MLTHGNIIADSTTFNYLKGFDLSNDDITFSFLPLAHMFERVVQSIIYTEGGRVGFFSGDIKELPDDLVALRPTIMPVVPRVLNRVHDKVMAEVNKSKIMKAIFDAAINYKMYELERGIVRNTSWADQIIFKKIRDSFGGRLKLMITGSAPVAEDVLSFTRCTLGCSVIEGYGQTESVAAVSIT
jgi:long-chain acyl-CoA synthetase